MVVPNVILKNSFIHYSCGIIWLYSPLFCFLPVANIPVCMSNCHAENIQMFLFSTKLLNRFRNIYINYTSFYTKHFCLSGSNNAIVLTISNRKGKKRRTSCQNSYFHGWCFDFWGLVIFLMFHFPFLVIVVIKSLVESDCLGHVTRCPLTPMHHYMCIWLWVANSSEYNSVLLASCSFT